MNLNQITLPNIRDYIQGNVLFALNAHLPKHIKEQIEFRAYACSDCLMNTKCLVCTCKTPAMFYSPNKVDKKLRWAQFLNENQWTALKNNIDIYKKFFDESTAK